MGNPVQTSPVATTPSTEASKRNGGSSGLSVTVSNETSADDSANVPFYNSILLTSPSSSTPRHPSHTPSPPHGNPLSSAFTFSPTPRASSPFQLTPISNNPHLSTKNSKNSAVQQTPEPRPFSPFIDFLDHNPQKKTSSVPPAPEQVVDVTERVDETGKRVITKTIRRIVKRVVQKPGEVYINAKGQKVRLVPKSKSTASRNRKNANNSPLHSNQSNQSNLTRKSINKSIDKPSRGRAASGSGGSPGSLRQTTLDNLVKSGRSEKATSVSRQSKQETFSTPPSFMHNRKSSNTNNLSQLNSRNAPVKQPRQILTKTSSKAAPSHTSSLSSLLKTDTDNSSFVPFTQPSLPNTEYKSTLSDLLATPGPQLTGAKRKVDVSAEDNIMRVPQVPKKRKIEEEQGQIDEIDEFEGLFGNSDSVDVWDSHQKVLLQPS